MANTTNNQSEYESSVYRMGIGFFFLFMAFNTTQALETTLLSDQTLAYATLGVLYGVFTATTIIAPKLVDILGPRIGMGIGAVPYVLLVFANIYPDYYTLIPASAGVGFGAGLLWTSQGIYLSRCAVREATATKQPVDTITSRFNGMFWTLFQSNAAVGLIVSSIILGEANNGKFSLKTAVTYMFIGFGVIGCAGIMILLSLKNAPSLNSTSTIQTATNSDDDDPEDGMINSEKAKAKQQVTLLDTLHLLVNSRAMLLLLPAIFYCGASLGFFGATFPLIYQDPSTISASSPAKLLPSSYVGYQAATFYATNSFFSYLWGKIVPVIGRRTLFMVTFVTAAAFFGLVILYTSGVFTIAHDSGTAYAYVFLLPVVFAAGDSVLESQLPAIIQSPTFLPIERERDAANSVYRMLQSIGYCAQFGLGIAFPCKDSTSACSNQAFILLPLLIVAIACIYICDKFVRPIENKETKDGHEYSAVNADD